MVLTQSADGNAQISGGTHDRVAYRRVWLGVALGTALLTVSFWALIYAFVEGAVDGGGQNLQAIGAGALGVALVPLVFVVVAFVSGHPGAPLATLQAMALALVVGIPMLAIIGSPITGLVVGYGAGAVAALRPQKQSRTGSRIFAVAVIGMLSMVLTVLAVPLSLAMAPSLPLTGVALADNWPTRVRHIR